MKKKCYFFFGIETVIYPTHNMYDLMKTIKTINEINLNWFIHFETCSKLCTKNKY